MLSGGQRPPGENLYNGTPPRVAGALDHVAFLAIDMIGDSVSIIPEGGVHIQLWIHVSNWLEVG